MKIVLLVTLIFTSGCGLIDDFGRFHVVGEDAFVCQMNGGMDGGADVGCVDGGIHD